MKYRSTEMETPIHAACPPLTGQIRPVKTQDAEAIADIYNEYIRHSTATFETTPLTAAEMCQRITQVASVYPYFVYEEEGRVEGYCYAHLWRPRAAYCHTLETSIYLAPAQVGRGIGTRLMRTLIKACEEAGYHALIACITRENQSSCAFHRRLGFQRVSRFEEVGRKFNRWLDIEDYELRLPASL